MKSRWIRLLGLNLATSIPEAWASNNTARWHNNGARSNSDTSSLNSSSSASASASLIALNLLSVLLLLLLSILFLVVCNNKQISATEETSLLPVAFSTERQSEQSSSCGFKANESAQRMIAKCCLLQLLLHFGPSLETPISRLSSRPLQTEGIYTETHADDRAFDSPCSLFQQHC